MLRTKAMRERDEQRERRKYNYSLLRVRMPDGTLLQGLYLLTDTFLDLVNSSRDKLGALGVFERGTTGMLNKNVLLFFRVLGHKDMKPGESCTHCNDCSFNS